MSRFQILLIFGALGYIIYRQRQAQAAPQVTLIPRGSSGNMIAIEH